MRTTLLLAIGTALWLSACSPSAGEPDASKTNHDTPSITACALSQVCLEEGAVECNQGSSRTCVFDAPRGCLQWSSWTACSALADACHQAWCTPGIGCEVGEVTCDDFNPCTGEKCDPKKGCLHSLNNGAGCDDGSLCTKKDTCFQGFCYGSPALSCPASDGCHLAGECDPATGACSTPALPDGTGCSDLSLCTTGDTCLGGVCTGSPTCASVSQCQQDVVCDPATGQCMSLPHKNGTACDDNNACTTGDSCQSGECVSGAAVACSAEPCHLAGTCDPATGVCDAPVAPAGTPCSDGAACTYGDVCQLGVCVSGPCGDNWSCDEESAACACAQGYAGAGCNECAAGYGYGASGEVVVWGSSSYGLAVVPPAAQSNIAAVAAGYFTTLALSTSGDVYAWGASSYLNAVPVAALHGVTAVECGGDRFCLALTDAGQVIAWGQNNSNGVLNVPVEAQSGVVAISAGYTQALALKDSGQVIGWGNTVPVPAAAQSGIVAVAAGTNHSLALTAAGAVIGWGNNFQGTVTIPTAAQSGIVAIAAGSNRSYALSAGGQVIQWGEPELTPAPSGVSSISAESNYAIALTTGGEAIPWGLFQNSGLATPPLWAQGRLTAVSAARYHAAAIVRQCADVNECQDGTAECGPNTTCINLPGSYSCECDPGYVLVGSICTFSCTEAGDGASCDDENACTTGDVCTGGACQGAAVVCPQVTPCHAVGLCDPSSGMCPITTLKNGTECNDGNACTMNDSCQAGVCTGGPAVVCAPADGCHTAGTCEPATGLCSSPIATDGTSCSDGLVCTFGDGCLGGVCVPESCGENWNCGEAPTPCACAPGYLGASCTECADGYESSGQAVVWSNSIYAPITVPVPAAATSGVVAVAAGLGFTFARKADGQVIYWGIPAVLAGIPAGAQTNVADVDCTGVSNSCAALTTAGGVVAWGQPSATNVPPSAQSGVVAIAVGHLHILALKSTGQVIAWGGNSYGQSTVPASAQSGIVAIAAGASHSMALTAGGAVIVWGHSGTNVVPPGAQTNIVAIAAGWLQSFALRADGQILSWGYPNLWDYATLAVPAGVATIAAGEGHVLTLTTGGEVTQWDTFYTSSPAEMPPAWAQGRFTAISAARHTCAAVVRTCADIDECTDGTAICAPDTTCVNTPGSYDCECAPGYILVGGVCTFSCTAAGDGAACDDEEACTAGDACLSGECAGELVDCPAQDECHLPGTCDPTTGACTTPAQEDGTECDDGDLCTTSEACLGGECAGLAASCDALDDCHLPGACDPGTGECSNPLAPNGTSCSDGAPCTQWDSCALGTCLSGPCGDEWTCAIGEAGITCGCAPGAGGPDCQGCDEGYESIDRVASWGPPYYPFAPPASAQDGVVAVSGGYFHSLALTDGGQVIAWGSNLHGESTVPPQGQAGITAVAAGAEFSLALTAGGVVIAWGRGDLGQTTIPAAAQSGVIAIAAGWYHGLALKSSGEVVAWGSPSNGGANVPAAAQSGIVAVAAGGGHSLALTAGGQVLVWGGNGLGVGSPPASTQSGIVAIAAGATHSLALTAGGGVIGWGNSNGGTVPAQAASGVVALAAGVDFSLGLTASGHVLAWGYTPYLLPPSPIQGHVTAISAGGGHGLAIVHSCDDVDECALGLASCGPYSTCVNTLGGYSCDCDPGYIDVGAGCVAICTAFNYGAPCDDGDPCTGFDTCQKGLCGGLPILCIDDGDPCTADAGCDPASGDCLTPPSEDGSPCQDDNACTNDACKGGACVSAPLICPPPDPCHNVGSCDPEAGICVYGILKDTTACDDGDPCTKGEMCKTGVCTGGVDTCPN